MKNCIGCGSPFTPLHWRQTRCKPRCGQNRAYDPNHDIEFIGVDGEGVTRPDGSHDYVMLSVGDKTLDIRSINSTTNSRRLTHHEIFDFLYACYLDNPRAAYVGFYLNYDFTQWTRTLPAYAGRDLYGKANIAARRNKTTGVPFPVVVGDWEFDILAKRRFKLRPHVCVPKSGETSGCRAPTCGFTLRTRVFDPSVKYGWLYVCDAGPFWQMSLLKAIDPKTWPKPIVSEDDYAIIRTGKAQRANVYNVNEFAFLDDMALYNVTENKALGAAMDALNRGYVDINVRIPTRDWYGPGRAAQLWLDSQVGNKTQTDHTRRNLFESGSTIQGWVQDVARASYYGGWFEQFIHGHVRGTGPENETYEYDINSAYPGIISRLPCLCNRSRWYRSSSMVRPSGGELSLILGRVSGSDKFIGTASHRTTQGLICRPHETSGVYWYHELDACRRAGIIDSIDWRGQVIFTPCGHPPPLRGIADLYEKRLEVGKNSPQGKALKLIYNSSYGKMAQSIGNPKYGNPIYASLITAGCRTQILDAIATHPGGTESVSMVATDAVYFTEPHPELERSAREHPGALGEWDSSVKRNLTQFMPGIYWDDALREAMAHELRTGRQLDHLPNKSRGINARDLSRQICAIDGMFSEMLSGLDRDRTIGEAWPSLVLSVGFTLTSGSLAVARGKWGTCGNISTGEQRTINSNPHTKRDPRAWLSNQGIRTSPYTYGEGYVSTPYDKGFGGPSTWGDTFDGTVEGELAEALRGVFE